MEPAPKNNMKKLTAKQMKIASAAPPRHIITAADFKALRNQTNGKTKKG
jgi:hypothetical protein